MTGHEFPNSGEIPDYAFDLDEELFDFGDYAKHSDYYAPAGNGKTETVISYRDRRRQVELYRTQPQPPVNYTEAHRLESEEDDRDNARMHAYIARVEAVFEAERTANQPDFIKRCQIIEQALGQPLPKIIEEDQIFFKELVTDPEVFETWQRIFVERDREFLSERSKEKLALLKKVFSDDTKSARKTGGLYEVAHRRARRVAFRELELHPIHGSLGEISGSEVMANKFLPAETKTQTGSGDQFINGSGFVYGSFAELPHPFSGAVYESSDPSRPLSAKKKTSWEDGSSVTTEFAADQMKLRERQHLLDEAEFTDADIAMFDIHFCKIGPKSGTGGFLDTYLKNYFDYETGKEILRVYLALIFETPAEARAYLATGEAVFERFYKEHSGTPYSAAGLPETRIKEIDAKMRELFYTYGLAPPFMSEIRIPERAKIVQSGIALY